MRERGGLHFIMVAFSDQGRESAMSNHEATSRCTRGRDWVKKLFRLFDIYIIYIIVQF